MRKKYEEQMIFGEVDIAEIGMDVRSRDEMPKVLIGLQYIYTNIELRKEVFNILDKIRGPQPQDICEDKDPSKGQESFFGQASYRINDTKGSLADTESLISELHKIFGV